MSVLSRRAEGRALLVGERGALIGIVAPSDISRVGLLGAARWVG